MRYRNIVISGEIGSGSTTLAKNLARELGFEYVSVGEIFRKIVKENNLPLITTLPPDWDFRTEKQLKERLEKEVGLVVEGHYQGWNTRNIPNTLRILVKCDPKIASRRVDKRTEDITETAEEIEKRKLKHQKVFRERYGNDDFLSPKFYHLVIDTTDKTIEQTLSEALSKFRQGSIRQDIDN